MNFHVFFTQSHGCPDIKKLAVHISFGAHMRKFLCIIDAKSRRELAGNVILLERCVPESGILTNIE